MTIRIGIVGIGFMGRIHFLAGQRLRGATVAAVCSRDPKKLAGDWSTTRGNFGPPPGQVDLSSVKRYATLDELLKDRDRSEERRVGKECRARGAHEHERREEKT